MIRVAWNVFGQTGHLSWFDTSEIELVSKFVRFCNKTHGEGTHWIEVKP